MNWGEPLPSNFIGADDMMTPMLEVCPSFEPAWREFLADWEGKPGDVPYYIALADLARHLIGMLERGETGSFDAIFDVVERWHALGDAYVREAATIGLLEDLQNLNLWSDHDGDITLFEKWLRPLSRRGWFEVVDFWEKGSSSGKSR